MAGLASCISLLRKLWQEVLRCACISRVSAFTPSGKIGAVISHVWFHNLSEASGEVPRRQVDTDTQVCVCVCVLPDISLHNLSNTLLGGLLGVIPSQESLGADNGHYPIRRYIASSCNAKEHPVLEKLAQLPPQTSSVQHHFC